LNNKKKEHTGSFYHSGNRDQDASTDIDNPFEGVDALILYSLTPGSTSEFKNIKVCDDFCEGGEALLNNSI